MEYFIGQKKRNTKASGWAEQNTAKETWLSRMVVILRDVSFSTKYMVKASITTPIKWLI